MQRYEVTRDYVNC